MTKTIKARKTTVRFPIFLFLNKNLIKGKRRSSVIKSISLPLNAKAGIPINNKKTIIPQKYKRK